MYEDIKQKYQDLESRLSDPVLMNDQKEMVKVSQEHAGLRDIVAQIQAYERLTSNIEESKDIINGDNDQELKDMAALELPELEASSAKLYEKIEDELHPDNPNDKKNAIIEIRGGAGGDEAALFAGDLFRMYIKYCEKNGLKIEVLDSSMIGIGGYKEVVFSVTGNNAYGLLKYEAGTHRVQRVPETEKQGRVHTSTATVVVLPEAEEVDLEIKMNDLRIDTFCSSGPGGQCVNTTYSAIRIVHIPTGTTVSCQDQKSQHQNKEKALQVLRSRLLAQQEEKKLAEQSSARKTQIGVGDRSEKIRTYNFPQDRVTDHRINQSWHSITLIMEGNLDHIITALKNAAKEEQKNQGN
jgi:peptide chain release factor 1